MTFDDLLNLFGGVKQKRNTINCVALTCTTNKTLPLLHSAVSGDTDYMRDVMNEKNDPTPFINDINAHLGFENGSVIFIESDSAEKDYLSHVTMAILECIPEVIALPFSFSFYTPAKIMSNDIIKSVLYDYLALDSNTDLHWGGISEQIADSSLESVTIGGSLSTYRPFSNIRNYVHSLSINQTLAFGTLRISDLITESRTYSTYYYNELGNISNIYKLYAFYYIMSFYYGKISIPELRSLYKSFDYTTLKTI